MEFIKVEEFLEQDTRVQKVLLDWFNKNISRYDLVQDGNEIMLYKDYLERGYIENDSYPLFTEGQLREFIKDKESDKHEIICHIFHNFNIKDGTTTVYKGYYQPWGYDCESLGKYDGDNMIRIYWNIAIAKEEINNDRV